MGISIFLDVEAFQAYVLYDIFSDEMTANKSI
jgi:hypothetical protein